jgi:hypothetical protein
MGGMIKCLKCGQILHSMYRHDFQKCNCENESFVDGGFDYTRCGGMDLDKIRHLDHEHIIDASGQEAEVLIKVK